MLTAGLVLATAAGAFAKDDPAEATRIKKAHDQVSLCLKAKKGSDLDSLAAELSSLKAATSQENFALQAQIAADERFVLHWRDFLNAYQIGNKSNAFDSLYELINAADWPYPVPRSLVLDRFRENHIWRSVSYGTNTIEDLPIVITKLAELERVLDAPGQFKKAMEPFQALIHLWEQRDQLSAEQIVSRCRFDSEEPMDVVRFKLLILSYALPAYLNLDKKYEVTPAKGEAAPAYLLRLRKLAIANDDLVALWRISTYYQYLTNTTSEVAQSEQKAMEYTLKGQRAQGEKKDMEATLHYRSALQFHGNRVTEKLAKAGLLELQKSAPAAYEQGAFMIAPPPTRRDIGGYDYFSRQQMEDERRSPGERQIWKDY